MKHMKMKSVLVILLSFVLLISGCAGQGGTDKNGGSFSSIKAGTAPVPKGNEVRDKYDMELTLDADQKTLQGSVKIVIHNTSKDEWTQICLRDYIPAMGRTQEELEGKKAEAASQFTKVIDTNTNQELEYTRNQEDASVVFVNLPTPLAAGAQMEMEVSFLAQIPQEAIRFRWSEPSEGKLVFELANFYPVLAIYENGGWQYDSFFLEGECFYSKCADYTVTLRVPEDYTVAASGSEERLGSEDGLASWKITAENMRDMAITTGSYLKTLSGTAEGIQVNCYYFDTEKAKKQADIMMETGKNAVKLFTRLFGKYPYDSLDLVMTSDFLNGIEYPANVRIGDSSRMLGEENEAETIALIKEVTAHETAHQWFYAVVGNNSYREPWLDESFASFAELIYAGEYESREAMEQIVEQTQKPSADYGGVFLNETYQELGAQYTTSVYIRGKIFLYDLMELMGEEEFFKMMQEYYASWGLKESHTKDFIDLVYQHNNSKEVKKLVEEYIQQ